MTNRCKSWILALGLTVAATAAHAVQGAGSLFVAGATNTPTHWNIQVGVTTTAEIRGVLPSEVGDPLPATIDVIVKSSTFGNTTLTGTLIPSTSDYTFDYTPPAHACGTTIVAYVSNGLNTNNDLLDDGLQNGSSNAACGFRFVTAGGAPIDCEELGVEPSAWSGVKRHFR